MVAEGVVLLGVQHFEQGAGRVAPEVHAHFVDFIQQKQRVARAGLVQALQHFAGHGADVGAAVAPDFGFVAHAAQRHAHVFAARGARDGLAQRGFAHAGRPHQTEDGGLDFVHALLHGQVLQDAFLDFFQPEVVGVEHFFGVGQVMFDARFFRPGQARQHVHVVAHHAGFGGHGRHQAQLFQLVFRLFQRLFGHAGGLDALFDFFNVRTVFAFAQLFLNGLDLLVQVEVALVFLHLALDAAANALVHVEDVHLALDFFQQRLQAFLHVGHFQHLLLDGQLQRHVRGDGVGQALGFGNAGDGIEDVGLNLLELGVLLELLRDGAAQRLGLGGVGGRGRFRRHGQYGGLEKLAVFHALQRRALLALHQHFHRAVGQLEHLQHSANAAGGVQVGHGRLILAGSALRHQGDAALSAHGRFQRLDALGPPHEQRDDHVRKHHHIAQGHQRHVHRLGRQQGQCGHEAGNPCSKEVSGIGGAPGNFKTPPSPRRARAPPPKCSAAMHLAGQNFSLLYQ